tara:strand:- start:1652 stop:1855 length:204 start_codon:yes stop_codon:yes gene_type:complete
MPKLFKLNSVNTVTVGELVERLRSHPQDMPVAYTWEGQILPVKLDEIEVMQGTRFVHGSVLLLDAET